MCYRNLPIATRERITDYYEHKYTQKRLFNEDEILSEVSPPLRNVSIAEFIWNIISDGTGWRIGVQILRVTESSALCM